MTLVDSCGWLEVLIDGPLADRYAAYLADPAEVITPTIVLYEVYKKVRLERNEEDALRVAAQIEKTRIIPLTESIALTAADLGLAHRLAMADAIVYATAVLYSARLVTSDADFELVPEVTYLARP